MTAKLLKYFVFIFILFIGGIQTSLICASEKEMDTAVSYYEDKRYDDAKLILEELWEKDNKNSLIAFYIGRIYLSGGNYNTSVKWLKKAIKIDNNKSEYHAMLGQALGHKAKNSNFFKKAFLAKKIKNSFEKAVELDPRNIEARSSLVEFYLKAPHVMGGSKEKALSQAKAIMEIDSLKGFIVMGSYYQHMKDYERAEINYLDGIKKYPDNEDLYVELASVYSINNNYESSFSILEKSLLRDSESLASYYHIGRLASLSGHNLDRGEECLQTYINKESEDNVNNLSNGHYQLGLLYEKKGSIASAKSAYKTAFELNEDHKLARQALQRLLKEAPNDNRPLQTVDSSLR